MEKANWLAIAVATIITMMLGFIWYGKMAFGKAWMKTMNFTEEDAKKGNMAVMFGVSFVMAFLLAVFINIFISHGIPDHATFGHGAFHGALLGVFVAMPVMVTNSLFEMKSFANMLINVGYWIANMALMGGVLGAFQ